MTHPLDEGRGRFRRLVAEAIEAEPDLPLVHGTDAYKFLNALDDGELRPQPCDIFTGEALLYFFYGRPSYRANPDAEPTSLAHYFPILLILKPDARVPVTRMFPFDSGAFERRFYASFVHHDMRLGDFGLDVDPASPGRVISTFFGDAQSYLRAEPAPMPEPPPEQMEAASYRSIITARESNALDSRGAAIEVQSDAVLPLAGQVQAAILPATFLDKGSTGGRLASLGIHAIPYMIHGRSRPSEYVTTITDLCYRFYVETGLFAPGVVDAGS